MIVSSNQLEFLLQKLVEKLKTSTGNVFDKDFIVTQSAGMSAWIRTEIARHEGVFANFSFVNQDSLFSEIYQVLFNEKIRNNTDALKYEIYNLLAEEEFSRKFPETAKYYNGSDLRRVQLAGKVADLFDQYQLYRNNMLAGWGNDKYETSNPAETWQKWLWDKLSVESRFKIRDRVIARMKENEALIKEAFPRISLFGITIFTEFHLEFFKILSEITSVDFYLCLPTFGNDFRNELLLDMGSKAGELMHVIEKKLGPLAFAKNENEVSSSLSKLQQSIVNNENDLKFQVDGSVQIVSCYTPVREAECLYNYLLESFVNDDTLKPGDILVMATDINKYAPLIKAVFRDAPVKIPFQISGAANNSEDSITAAVEQILKFTEEDLTSEKVVSLLEQKRIRQRFRIKDPDYVRSVVRKANIRFGRENRKNDDTIFVSWKYGLEKILLGYAMLTEKEFPLGNDLTVYPYRDTEAVESHDLFRLKAFVEKLECIIDNRNKGKTLPDWKQFLLEDVIEQMVYHDDFDKDDRTELSSVYKALSFIENVNYSDQVPFQVFLNELDSKLFNDTWKISLGSGNVTVSSAIPVRGIPFRIICFLGLDNEVFPRKNLFMGFDLLGETYLSGDRNKRETDKYLFLDTILSAREKLYLSYIGRSVKDNTEIPPSIVVDSLIEYLDSESILKKHPLHGYSSQYNEKEKDGMFTYLYGKTPGNFNPKDTEQKGPVELSPASFIKFFENPVDWYFDNVLDIKYEEKDDTIPETEIFNLDSLQKWSVKQDILKLNTQELEIYLGKGIKEGWLPLKNLGSISLEDITFEISELKSGLDGLAIGKTETTAEVDLSVNGVRIMGNIGGIYSRKYICHAFSDRSKYKVRAYLNALLLYSEGIIETAEFLCLKKRTDKKNPASLQHESIGFMDPSTAKDKLNTLIQIFTNGKSAPLKFTPDAARRVIDREAVENVFLYEAEGNEYKSIPKNLCISNLYEEDYFKEFDVDDFSKRDFNPEIYDKPVYSEILTIAELLNITK